MGNTMRVEVVVDAARFIEIETDWDELYKRDPAAHIFLSSRFIGSIVVRLPGRFRVLVAWSDDGVCIGALPLHLKTKWSKTARNLFNELDMLGHVFDADYTGLLCDPAYEDEVCAAFAREISGMASARLTLSFFRAPQTRVEKLRAAFDEAVFEVRPVEKLINDGQTNNLLCPAVDLPDSFEAYLGTLSANSRQKLRRLLRQLDSDPALRVTRSRPETYKQDTDILSELWFLQYAEQKGQKRARNLSVQARDVLAQGLASGLVYLAVLWREGKPVAAQANYIDPVKGEALFHVGARDGTVQDLAIGLMLQAHAIRWAIAQGLRRYDFTIGDEPYKYSFGAVDQEIASLEVRTRHGGNPEGRLDPVCREDVQGFIEKFVARGRADDARVVAAQALEVWPDMEAALRVENLISQSGS